MGVIVGGYAFVCGHQVERESTNDDLKSDKVDGEGVGWSREGKEEGPSVGSSDANPVIRL